MQLYSFYFYRTMKFYILCLLSVFLWGCGVKEEKEISSDASPKTIMAVFAHPDDEIDVSPLLTQLASKGHKVYLVIATKGDKGVRDHAKIPAGDSLTAVRAAETACTCSILGIQPPVMLGLPDGNISNNAALKLLRTQLDSVFTLHAPDVVITWGAEGGSGHPDHRMVGAVVTEIFQSGQGSKIPLLFYTAIPTEHWHDEPAYQSEVSSSYHRNYKTVEKKHLPVRIFCDARENEIARKAMRCYASQYPPEELDDNERWMKMMNRDTVYLRPYIFRNEISSDIFR